jgi:hypothetical protein
LNVKILKNIARREDPDVAGAEIHAKKNPVGNDILYARQIPPIITGIFGNILPQRGLVDRKVNAERCYSS